MSRIKVLSIIFVLVLSVGLNFSPSIAAKGCYRGEYNPPAPKGTVRYLDNGRVEVCTKDGWVTRPKPPQKKGGSTKCVEEKRPRIRCV